MRHRPAAPMLGHVDRETALAQLPASFAVALRLQGRGMADPEIAEIIGIDVDALAAHLDLAEAKLARILEHHHQR